jgi:hypothetical protein
MVEEGKLRERGQSEIRNVGKGSGQIGSLQAVTGKGLSRE